MMNWYFSKKGVRVVSGLCLAFAAVGFDSGHSSAIGQSLRGFTVQGPAEASDSAVPRDAFGKPCLNTEAIARSHVTNRAVLDHIVSVRNDCPKTIKARICYYRSEQCNDVDVGSYKRVDTILGTMVGGQYFRYSVTPRK
ncbi:hypothetical protein ACVWYQ_003027 [Bradyrhizobium sp. USDA 3397]